MTARFLDGDVVEETHVVSLACDVPLELAARLRLRISVLAPVTNPKILLSELIATPQYLLRPRLAPPPLYPFNHILEQLSLQLLVVIVIAFSPSSAMASDQVRAPGSKPGENMLWGGRFTGLTHYLRFSAR